MFDGLVVIGLVGGVARSCGRSLEPRGLRDRLFGALMYLSSAAARKRLSAAELCRRFLSAKSVRTGGRATIADGGGRVAPEAQRSTSAVSRAPASGLATDEFQS